MAKSGHDVPLILLAEDDEGFRSFLRSLLEQGGYRVVECEGGGDALSVALEHEIDLVVADVKMPGGSGYELCRALRSALDQPPPIVLVSGSRTEAMDRAAGLELGADDYLVKPLESEEFLARIRALLRRSRQSEGAGEDRIALTRRERQVLRLLAEGMGQAGIAARFGIAPKTVGKHIERILTKLGVHSRGEAIVRAYDLGVVVPRSRRNGS